MEHYKFIVEGTCQRFLRVAFQGDMQIAQAMDLFDAINALANGRLAVRADLEDEAESKAR